MGGGGVCTLEAVASPVPGRLDLPPGLGGRDGVILDCVGAGHRSSEGVAFSD